MTYVITLGSIVSGTGIPSYVLHVEFPPMRYSHLPVIRLFQSYNCSYFLGLFLSYFLCLSSHVRITYLCREVSLGGLLSIIHVERVVQMVSLIPRFFLLPKKGPGVEANCLYDPFHMNNYS